MHDRRYRRDVRDMAREDLGAVVRGRRVLFITPSSPAYLRNVQEIRIIREHAAALRVLAPAGGTEVVPTGPGRVVRTILKALFVRKKEWDVVFIGGLPQPILFCLAPFLRRTVVVVDFFVSLFDTLVHDRGVLPPGSLRARFLARLDRYTLARADHVVVDTRAHGEYFGDAFGLDAEKRIVLYVEADRDVYYPRKAEKPPGLEGKFLVFFFGAMNPLQGVDVILQAASLLEKEEHIVFVLVGPYRKLQDAGRWTGLRNVRFEAEWLPQERIARWIACADLCLAGHFNARVPKARRVIAGKTFCYLAMERPTVVGENPANREVFADDTENVLFVPMGDPAALAEVILGASREGARGEGGSAP